MKILLIGYGKMGKAIERLSLERGHEIVGRINDENQDLLKTIDVSSIDVAIEFSSPNAAYENIKTCLERGIKIISGTTGWLDQYEEIKEIVEKKNGTFLYASNFSLGVNLFFTINKFLAQLMNPHDQYKPEMEEIHHTQKLDAPSGTAITLAEGLIENHSLKNKWVNESSDKEEDLSILSKRIGSVPGTHSVTYKSPMDEIEIKHTAHTRDSFALGAILVGEWIQNKSGFLSIEDFIQINH